ncbi:MAG: radical SAM protein, partial [Candidatus Omnitrophota bacterium]
VHTSRGCPYDCGYCFHGCGMKKINYFPLERALKEIEVIYSNPDVKHVNYADSDIFLNHQRTETIVKHILKQKSSAQSQFASNVLRINESLAKLLARLPDYRFCFSVQTTNPKALECIGRLRLNADDVVKKVKEFRRWLPSAEYFIDVMLGLPGDDLRGFKMTLDVCLSLEPTRIALNYPVYLLPGTKFFEEKKALGINYRPTPPFSVIETESFPKHDIERALKLVLWVDILTYFYPAIACFFYSVYVDGMPGTRISRMEKWISAIERNLDIFGFRQNMVDSATGSVQEWNKLKAQVLRRASETESAWQIYYTLQQEEAMHTASMRKTISLGVMIFDYLRSQEMDSVEFSHFDQLPDSIAKSYNLAEIKSVFSRFRR